MQQRRSHRGTWLTAFVFVFLFGVLGYSCGENPPTASESSNTETSSGSEVVSGGELTTQEPGVELPAEEPTSSHENVTEPGKESPSSNESASEASREPSVQDRREPTPEIGPEPTQEAVLDASPEKAPEVLPEPLPESNPDKANCPKKSTFGYTCKASDPSTCPGGICLLGFCIGPKLDPKRWDSCGDGVCGKCETAQGCPADCGKPPTFTGSKKYDGAKTITVWVHGFSNKGAKRLQSMEYGAENSCGGFLGALGKFGVKRPCGNTATGRKASNHIVGVEYYGGKPASWLTAQQIKAIDAYPYNGAKGLMRYAIIVAKFIRWRMKLSGATHVNLACHSMGCLISRHLIEHDLEKLASENVIVRWTSSAGVIAGARLARLYDNPNVQQTAKLLQFELNDFVIMNPDAVKDGTAIWDHKLYEMNNPLFQGILIHHQGATDPKIKEALNIQLLDLNNPTQEPNDGIMYTLDQYFHKSHPKASFVTPSKATLSPSRSLVFVDHMTLPKTDAFHAVGTAALFHKRKVYLRLKSLTLLKDRENKKLLDGENGKSPAEIGVEVEVRYNPYLQKLVSKDILVHQDTIKDRTTTIWTQKEGQTLTLNRLLFAAPVFDAMKKIQVRLRFLEIDWYPRFKVSEWALDIHEMLFEFNQGVDLKNGTIPFSNQYVKGVLEVKVETLY